MAEASTGLAMLVEDVLRSLAGISSASVEGLTTWTRSGRPFAALGPVGIEIRLDRPIAAAAMRTPDVGPSPHGADWVRFNPRELDAHAADRLRAWLELAYRRAGG